MDTTESLNPKPKLWCLIRKKWIVSTPEEKIRQAWLSHLIRELGFPSSLISLENHCDTRRSDIVCFKKHLDELRPILLIECKAVKIEEKHLTQLLGYNYHFKAHCVALVSDKECHAFFQKKANEWEALKAIPSHQELM